MGCVRVRVKGRVSVRGKGRVRVRVRGIEVSVRGIVRER